MQCVVRVKDLFVKCLSARLHELDVVDEQHIILAVTLVQRELCSSLDRPDEVIQECFGGHVENLAAAIVLLDVVANRVEQVSFAKSGVSIDHEGVIGPTRSFSN